MSPAPRTEAGIVDAEQFAAAFALAERAEALAPQDPMLSRLRQLFVRTPTIRSEPPDASWTTIGRTPLDPVKVPAGYYRWRFEKTGFAPSEQAARLPRPGRRSSAFSSPEASKLVQ